MKQNDLGKTGLKVSEICLGTATFGGAGSYERVGQVDQADADRIIATAMDNGINLFNTAEHYSAGLAEERLGKALGAKRKDVIVIDKVCPKRPTENEKGGLSREHIFARCEASLKRLGTDYIDIYELHIFDPIVPLEETLGALDELVHQGKVRYFGCSNFAGWQFMKGLSISDTNGWNRFTTLESKYTLLARELENELIPACIDQGVEIFAFAPLHGGYLSGKYARNKPWPLNTRIQEPITDANSFNAIDLELLYNIIDELSAIANDRNIAIAHVALNYLLRKPGIRSLIVGVRNTEQLEDNLKASGWELTSEEVSRIDKISEPVGLHPYRENKFGFLYSPEA